jgi:hypothetical protein
VQSEVANKTECGLLGDLRWHRRPTGQLRLRESCSMRRKRSATEHCGNCPDTMIAPHLRGRTDRNLQRPS